MKKRTLVGLLLVSAVSLPLLQVAFAAPSTSPLIDKEFDGALGKFLAKKFCKRIDASDEQTEKITKIVAATREETRPMREELRQGLIQLSTMVARDDATDEQIKAKAMELRSMHEKVMDVRLESALKARHVLNHDQLEKINKRLTNLLSGDFTPNRLQHAMRSSDLDDAAL